VKTVRSPDLRLTQELFWTLITAPEGVRPAIEDLGRRGVMDERGLDDLFIGDQGLPALERLDIYANMYFYRLLDCLAEDFPKLLAALGPARFHNLITDYLLRHPSVHPSLRHLGRHLPQFIASHPLASEFSWAADLARLDWARADLFDAPDATPLSRDALARLPQDRAGEARFSMVPAFALLRFDHEVVRYWRRLEEGGAAGGDETTEHGHATGNAAREKTEADDTAAGGNESHDRPDPPRRRSTAARVWRKDFVVYHRGIDEDEVRCLELVGAGESIARMCQGLAAGRSVAKATERAGRMIQGWLDDGILADVTLP
jgi:putative DNA-binding protein